MPSPGLADFSAKLVGDYSIQRTSSANVKISPDAYDPTTTPIIPTVVRECAVHDRFVLAKRQGLKRRTPDDLVYTNEPDPNAFDFWILDTAVPKVFGPMTSQQFTEKRSELGVPESVVLKDIWEFRP